MKTDRLLAIGDIHGEYDMLCTVLDKANYTPKDDTLILIGDYIDRGPQSQKTVEKVKELTDLGAIALKGNHEDMAYNYACELKEEQSLSTTSNNKNIYFSNGGRQTLDSYSNIDKFIEDAMWLNELPVYKKINKYIFVHGGLKPGIELKNQSTEDMLWIRNEFLMHDWVEDDYIDETIVAGHTPFGEIKYFSQSIIIDTGAGKGGYLSLIDLSNDKIYYSL